jgi:hypothetical protein
MASIYFAARYSRREQILEYANQVRAAGHEVTCRWLNGQNRIPASRLGDVESYQEDYRQLAQVDWEDIRKAEICIFFTEEAGRASGGGRHVEFGIALQSQKECWVIGPKENLFYCLPQAVQMRSWEEAMARLAKSEAVRAN